MAGSRLRIGGMVAGLLGLALALAPGTHAGSLPRVSSGARPGPPMLYARSPRTSPLTVTRPFRVRPLLVSGSDAYRGGEYLYQDYLFDDRGADTSPGQGSRFSPQYGFSPTAGDVLYPTDERYAGNAADLVELRIKPRRDAIVYRVTLNTVKEKDAAVVGIGIDTDRRDDEPVDWPGGAGISSPGLDRFITAWGTDGEVTDLQSGETTPLPDDLVSIDRELNQMTIRVPRDLMDPGRATWRYVAGTGLWSGDGWTQVEEGTEPGDDEPASGSSTRSAPAVFNLAFRFDEPQFKSLTPPYDTQPGHGNWFEEKQSVTLADETSGDFFADVDFGKLAQRSSKRLHTPDPLRQARIYASRLDVPEGVHGSFPEYGGKLQPYLISVPPDLPRRRPAPLTFTLHSLDGTYTQYAVFSPNQIQQLGVQRDSIVVSPLGRGPDGWYTDEAEVDFFEVWRDVARHYRLDPRRVALSGYSMGGYGTYKLGTHYPDLFGTAFTAVGPPAEGIWVPPAPPTSGQDTNTNPLLENVRWIPYLNWVGTMDELVPYAGPRAQQDRFNALGLRSQLWTFPTSDHFALAILDQWRPARDFLGEARVEKDPWRVNYAFMPAADRPELGLVHDHAYWVSKLRVRDDGGDPETDPARGEIDARSLAHGLGDPTTAPVTTATPGPPLPAVVDGVRWTGTPDVPRQNALELTLENVGNAIIAGRRARLRGDRPLRVRITSDGEGVVRLRLPLGAGAKVRRIDGAGGPAPEVALTAHRATFTVSAGTREYLISPGG